MPNYKYLCENCNYSFVELQKITDPIIIICPQCKKKSLKRLIGRGSGIIFKGSGFYTTDYKKTKNS